MFADPENSGKMTEVTHIGGSKAKLCAEDQFEKDKNWEVMDNWCELRAQLKVGRAVTKVLELFDEKVRDNIQREWANNKEYLQKIANEKNNATDDNEDAAESSVPSAASAAEAAAPPPAKRVRIVKAPPPRPEGGKVRARRTT